MKRNSPINGLGTALRTLTLISWPGKESEELTASLPWFPVVGLFLGLVQAIALDFLGEPVSLDNRFLGQLGEGREVVGLFGERVAFVHQLADEGDDLFLVQAVTNRMKTLSPELNGILSVAITVLSHGSTPLFIFPYP